MSHGDFDKIACYMCILKGNRPKTNEGETNWNTICGIILKRQEKKLFPENLQCFPVIKKRSFYPWDSLISS